MTNTLTLGIMGSSKLTSINYNNNNKENTMSETRKQRTPAELIAETQAKLEKLQVRMAKQDAKSNPELAPLFDALDDQRKVIREAKKGLGEGPQSFESRIAKHERWIDKIIEERSSAKADLLEAELAKEQLEASIQAKIVSLNINNTNTATN